jgi:multicomponent Na+:H+ antiporter subunit A
VLVMPLVLMGLAAVLAPVLAQRLGRNTGYAVSAVFVVALTLLLLQSPIVMAGGTVTQSWIWVPQFGVEFTLRLNGLSLLFASLVLGVGALVLSYCPPYLNPGYDHGRLFSILTLFAAAMLGLVLAGDLILLIVFWEITTVCSFLLVAGRGLDGARPAVRALVVTVFGGLALLAAAVLLIIRTGTSQIDVILQVAPEVLTSRDMMVIGPLIVIAAFTKSAQIPFHWWLPGAMVAITPISAYLHAATLVKAGIYLLLLFSPLFVNEPGWHLTLMGVGLATMVFGAFQALRQVDLKALLAYSTVSQLGMMVALVGVGTSASLAAAVLLVTAHALFKATLFMLVGIIDREAGSRDIRELSGLWRAMPITAVLTGLAAMSLAGIPPLVGFVAKEESFYAFVGTSEATWAQGTEWAGWAAAFIAVLGVSLTFAYSARILKGAFGGPLKQTSLYEPSLAFLAPAAIPAVAGLVLGIAPWLVDGIVDRATIDTGFTPTVGGLALLPGLGIALLLSVIAIGLGLLIFLRQTWIDAWLGTVPPPARAPVWFDRGWDGLLTFGARVGRAAQSTSIGVHLTGVALLLLALAVGTALVYPDLAPAVPGVSRPIDALVLVVLLPAVVALTRAPSALAALVLAGIIGLVLAVWLLLLGAPDVALTLLLVEILTVVVAAPALARLPRPRRPRGRPAITAIVAIGVGAMAGIGTWIFTGRRAASPAAEYYLTMAQVETGGRNVVNTILVDFRGLDTFGEIVVLAAAIWGLLAARAAGALLPSGPSVIGVGERMVLRVGSYVVIPLLLLLSVVLFWRGHNEPGGGFIAGLGVGAALVVARIAGVPIRVPPIPVIVSTGLALVVVTGLMGLVVAGVFLEPFVIRAPGTDVSILSSLIFDFGVLLVVVGLVLAAVDRLAGWGRDEPHASQRGEQGARQ